MSLNILILILELVILILISILVFSKKHVYKWDQIPSWNPPLY